MKRIIFFLLFWATGYLVHSQTIDAAEYFFDDDPGYGLAIPISVTSGIIIDENFSVATSGLGIGFHTLYVRAQGADGAWGLPESRLVYVDATGAGNVSNISLLEYFFDDDPGYGLGLPIFPGTPSNVIDIASALPTGSLQTGFHTLYVRAQDDNGTWGINESRLVFANASGAGTAANLDQMEFFFDDDPGYGLATAITSFTPGNILVVSEMIDAMSLASGFHTLYVRTRTDSGEWGLPESRLVFVDASGAGSVVDVTQLEYYFDDDPGYGAATLITPATPMSVVDIAESVSTASLATGFHTFYIRGQSDGGSWGLSESRLVFVDNSGAGTAVNVDLVEYYFNEDPGFGAGTNITPATPMSMVDLVESISTASLPTGFHTLFVRSRNDGGVWGLSESRLVFVDDSGAGLVTNVDLLEYYFDVDPGFGAATSITPATPMTTIDLLESISTASLPTGFHTIFVRSRNDGGVWGLSESRLVFVDASGAGLTTNVDLLEYYFNVDPGYGAGTTITPATPMTTIALLESISTATLPTGFHTLYVRAQNEGGAWGFSESRLVFVDASGAGSVTNVSQVEYFFDDDPGFGLGTIVNIGTPSNQIDINEVVDASSLTLGFHTLYLRAQDENGVWGSTESKLIYIDPSGSNTVTQIDQLEYFFDIDPGFGSATAIPFTAANDVTMDVVLPASALTEGEHTLTIRPQNVDGNWGLGETFVYSSLSPSRELDSLSLKVFYNKTDGANWATNTNWLTGTLDTWFGVDVVNGRVDSVQLAANDVVGTIPKELSYISELKKVDLSFNQMRDTIPDDFVDLAQLQTFIVNNNDFSALPDMSTIGTLQTMALDTNFFDFGDLEALVSIPTLTYKGQKVEGSDADSLVRIGQALDFDFMINGSNNTYQWFQDDEAIPGATAFTYSLPSFALLDTGTYRLDVQNTVVTDLTISSKKMRAQISELEQDSLAMVSIYNDLDGPSWTTSSNWLSGNLDTWFGLTVTDQRVRSISLPSNGATGKFPMDINLADSLTDINFAGNAILDTIPTTFADLRALQTLNLSNNMVQSIPPLNVITTLDNLNVSGNRLQFGDLEMNLGVTNFDYSAQALISAAKDTLIENGASPNLSVMNSGLNNSFEWFKDGSSVSTDEVLPIAAIDFADEGVYRLDITNSIVTGLTLSSGDINVRVSSLERDTKALQKIFEDGGGTLPANWSTTDGDIVDNTWQGVTLNGDETRVIGIGLPNNNMDGFIPDELLEITQLETADFSQNELTSLPNLTVLEQLTSFNMSDNRLGFAPIETNGNLADGVLDYSNQKNIDIEETGDPEIKVQVNEDQTLSVVVNGSQNTYQWSLDGSEIAGATSSTYDISGIDINQMGDYSVVVASDSITDLSISSNPRTVLAVTDVFGTIFNPDGVNPLENGNITIYEIQDGPYDSLTTVTLGTDGSFLFDDIILGDYNLLSRPDLAVDPEYLQTYLGNGIFWEEADTLFLRDVLTGLPITMQGPPADPVGDAAIFGVVEQDLPEGGRLLLPRRRSGRAGCAFRRSRGVSRDDDDFELVAYTETNEDGEFRVDNLEDGEYLFNVEFPGVPMDPNSFIAFNLGENLDDSELQLFALIEEDGITVEKIEEVGIPTPLFRSAVAYPNPTQDYVNIRYSLARPVSGLQMEVVGVDGVIYMQQELDAAFGLKESNLDLTGMAAGMYMLIFQDTEGKYRQQLRITKH